MSEFAPAIVSETSGRHIAIFCETVQQDLGQLCRWAIGLKINTRYNKTYTITKKIAYNCQCCFMLFPIFHCALWQFGLQRLCFEGRAGQGRAGLSYSGHFAADHSHGHAFHSHHRGAARRQLGLQDMVDGAAHLRLRIVSCPHITLLTGLTKWLVWAVGMVILE